MIRLDPSSSTAPYEQVRAQLAAQIVDGTLAVGAKLPTVRGLAEQLSLAPNTVAKAYAELEQSGLTESRGRAGTFVAATGDKSRTRVRDAARDYARLASSLGLSTEEALAMVTAAFAD